MFTTARLGLVLLLVGCGTAPQSNEPLEISAAEASPCYNNIDCAGALACISGLCKALK